MRKAEVFGKNMQFGGLLDWVEFFKELDLGAMRRSNELVEIFVILVSNSLQNPLGGKGGRL